MVWVGTSCRWERGRVACWRREVAGALCAARWPLARRKIARHRMLNLGETRRKHVSGIFWVSKRRRYCNEHPLGGSAARCPQPTCRTRRLLSCRCGFLERSTCGFQLQSRHPDIGSIFLNMYGYARTNVLVAFARVHDRLMCSNYARGHARKYVWAHALASFYVQLLHRNGAFSCDFRQVSGRRR